LSATLLVVDDEIDLQESVCETLTDAGYHVICKANGRQALDYLLDQTQPLPDLVILDLQMPVMSGWELLKIIRSYARLAKLPVLVISAGERVAKVAPEHRLAKPFTSERLLEAIEKIVHRS
jgi:CheY-like chemotaxis protein